MIKRYTRLTTPNSTFLPNRIIHLGLLRKSPFGPPGLEEGFPIDSSGCLRHLMHGAFTISIRVDVRYRDSSTTVIAH
jgi:hypothetical protein